MVHECTPSGALEQCDLSVAQFTAMITQPPPRAPVHPPLELLHFLAHLGRDPTLTPLLCTPPLLSSLRSPLLCGAPALQLAVVELLRALHETDDECGKALCSQNIDGFLLELSRTCPPSRTSSQTAPATDESAETRRLDEAVRSLLVGLLSVPRHDAASLCLRLLDAATAAPVGTERRNTLPSLALVEHHIACLSALLGWYSPSSPREISLLAEFCHAALPRYMNRSRLPPADGAASSEKGRPSHNEGLQRLSDALCLLASVAEACMPYETELHSILELCDEVVFPSAMGSLKALGWKHPKALSHLAALLSALLDGRLAAELRHRFVQKIEHDCVLLLTISQRCHLVPIDEGPPPSHARLAASLLRAKGFLPWQWQPSRPISVGVISCAAALDDAEMEVDGAEDDAVASLEWLLLLLNHFLENAPTESMEDGAEESIPLHEAQACRARKRHQDAPPSQHKWPAPCKSDLTASPAYASRLTDVWTRFTSYWPLESSTQTSHELTRILLRLPPLELIQLPPHCVRWLWAQDDYEADLAMLLIEWAVWCHSRLAAGASTETPRADPADPGKEDLLPSVQAIFALCHCSDGNVALLTRTARSPTGVNSLIAALHLIVLLLSSHLPSLRAKKGSLEALLELVIEALNASPPDEEEGECVRDMVSSVDFLALLGRVFMSLPSVEARASGRTAHMLCLKLLSAVLVLVPRTYEAYDAFGALQHAVALLLTALHSGMSHTWQNAHDSNDSWLSVDDATTRLECVEILNFVNTVAARHDDALDALCANHPLAKGVAALLRRLAELCSSAHSGGGAGPGALGATSTLLLIQMLERLPALKRCETTVTHTLDAIRAAVPLSALPSLTRAATLQRGPLAEVPYDTPAAEATLCVTFAWSCAPRQVHAALTLRLITALQQLHAFTFHPEDTADRDPRTDEESRNRSADANGSHEWKSCLVAMLLNASTGRDDAMLCAAACCFDSFHSAACSEAAMEFSSMVAQQPWNGFALEMVALHCSNLTGAHCAYWAAILEQRPPWSSRFFNSKQSALRKLVLQTATPFTHHHVRLIRVLHEARACEGSTLKKAVDLLRFRELEPCAGRWQAENAHEHSVDTVRYDSATGFAHVELQVLVPSRLLLSLPKDRSLQPDAPAPASEEELVEEALNILSPGLRSSTAPT
ncbi:hypothetical protein AB1Y20_003704 [Prymnesium parvum]|uniref:Uncharacterized protein n=1 Tax=Prymnesium parvum TaxID=97485 RepID=A0AB34J7C4_PRYPA